MVAGIRTFGKMADVSQNAAVHGCVANVREILKLFTNLWKYGIKNVLKSGHFLKSGIEATE